MRNVVQTGSKGAHNIGRLACIGRVAGSGAFTLVLTANAFAGFNIGNGGGNTFAMLRQFFQDFVDFMDGPFGIAAVVISIVLAFATWAVLPREGIVGPIMRGVVSAAVLFNIATWLGAFR